MMPAIIHAAARRPMVLGALAPLRLALVRPTLTSNAVAFVPARLWVLPPSEALVPTRSLGV